MANSSLEKLFEHELRDVLDAEHQILKALPKLAKSASDERLKAAFEEHLSQTEAQVSRLEEIFKSINKAPRGKHCSGMEGLVKEGAELIKEEDAGPLLDAALICAAQKVEHYEIAAYGSLATYAGLLQMSEAQEFLEATLAEEKETDHKLSAIASELNLVAANEPVS